MAQKKHRSKPKHRNAAPQRAPSLPRAVASQRGSRRPSAEPETPVQRLLTGPETPMQRLAYTAAGAAGTALVGGFLAKQDWQPKTIASVLSAVGTAMAWAGDTPMLQSIGAGAMAAGGGQLVLQVMDDRSERALSELAKRSPKPRQANTSALPPGSLEAAFERARMHAELLTSDDYVDDLS